MNLQNKHFTAFQLIRTISLIAVDLGDYRKVRLRATHRKIMSMFFARQQGIIDVQPKH
jgi:hypothetical protein